MLIDSIKKTTLYSVSKLCGQKEPLVGIFTAVGTRFYPFKQMFPYFKLISENCDEVLWGKVENGLYIMESKRLPHTGHFLVSSVKDPSI